MFLISFWKDLSWPVTVFFAPYLQQSSQRGFVRVLFSFLLHDATGRKPRQYSQLRSLLKCPFGGRTRRYSRRYGVSGWAASRYGAVASSSPAPIPFRGWRGVNATPGVTSLRLRRYLLDDVENGVTEPQSHQRRRGPRLDDGVSNGIAGRERKDSPVAVSVRRRQEDENEARLSRRLGN